MLFNVGAYELLYGRLYHNLEASYYGNNNDTATRARGPIASPPPPSPHSPPPYCLVFHDVDLLPEHDANLYYCDNSMRHLAAGINEQRYRYVYVW